MICQDCGKTFADKRKLTLHRQNHAKDEMKCHICEKICIGNKKFLNQTNGEFTETTHSTFKISERQHNFHVNRMLGTPVHKEKAMKSIVWHNTRKAGFTPPSMFKMRKSSPYVMSSPITNKDI